MSSATETLARLEPRVLELRKDFPLLENQDIAYLDNAATEQRPRQVLDAVTRFFEEKNANPFRGVYDLSEVCTEAYEAARAATAAFIHAARPEEIIFTRNATESLNLVASSYARSVLKPGDEVVVSVMEHHSNFLPWRDACLATGATLVRLEPGLDGTFSEEAIDAAITPRTRIVALTQVSNVYGCVNDVKAVAAKAHAAGAVMVVDGAQSVPHMPVDVQDLDCDFLVFSGHKMLAPTGIGVLYGRYRLLEAMPPYMFGGEMIDAVHWDSVKYAEPPHRFEAGTVNTGGAAGLEAAIAYIQGIGFDFIQEQERALTELAVEGMRDMPGVSIVGSQEAAGHQGIITFIVDGVHPHDVAYILNASGVCVRAGHHCAQPLMDFLGVGSTTRVSFAFYNTAAEVERFITALGAIRGQMGYVE